MTTRTTTRRAFTGDRGPPQAERVEIHTREQIGPNMSRLPSGFLLCKNVPIARVGWMVYGPGETPIEVDPSTGLAYVQRDEDALFHPACIGSYMGSPVVDEHPGKDVTADNWKELGQGFSTTNVRRGEGEDADILIADLIITDAELITSVLGGKREVSCGYDADYEQTGVGQGKQTNIIGNHIALVEKGRCGPRCAIGDRAHQPKGNEMATQKRVLIPNPVKRRAVIDARRKVLDAEAALAEAEEGSATDDGEEGDDKDKGTHIHIHGSGAKDEEPAGGSDRLSKLETLVGVIGDQVKGLVEAVRAGAGTTVDKEDDDDDDEKAKKAAAAKAAAKAEDGEEGDDKDKDKDKGKTADSAALATSFAEVASQAEILVPGFRMSTFDAKAKRQATVDAMCSARRKALGLACSTKDGAALVTGVAGGTEPDIDALDCKEVASLFKAAAGAKALLNNSAATRDSGSAAGSQQQQVQEVKQMSVADINKANADFWAGR